jgi:hypothetical protein
VQCYILPNTISIIVNNKSKTNENKSKTREKIVFDLQLREFIIISKSVSTVLLGHRLGSQKQNMEQF